MTLVLILMLVQAVLGAADNLIHHELQARLPGRPGASASGPTGIMSGIASTCRSPGR